MIGFLISTLSMAFIAVVFGLGRMVGRRQGERRAAAELPIRLRTQFQLEQRCPICDDMLKEQVENPDDQG